MHRRAYFRQFSFRRDRVKTIVFVISTALILAPEGHAQSYSTSIIGLPTATLNKILKSSPVQIFSDTANAAIREAVPDTPGLSTLKGASDTADLIRAYQSGGSGTEWNLAWEKSLVKGAATAGKMFGTPGAVAAASTMQFSLDVGKYYVAPFIAPKIGDILAPYTADGRYAAAVEKQLAATPPPDPFGVNAEARRQVSMAAAAKAAAEKSAALQAITQQTQKVEGQYQVSLYQNCLTDAYSIKSTCATTFPRGAALAKQQANPQPAQAAAANQSVANLAPVAAPLPSTSPSSVKLGQFLTSAQALDAIGKGADPKNLRQLTAYESIVAIGNGLDPNGLWILQPAGSHPAVGSVPPVVPPATGLATTVAPTILATPYPVGAALGVRSLGGGLAPSDRFFRAVMNDPKRSLNERKFAAGMLQLNMPANSYSREIAGYLLGLPQPVPGVIKPIGLSSSPAAARNPSLANLGVTRKQVNAARAAPKANSAMPTRTSVAEASGRPAGVKTPEQLAAIHQARVRAARVAAQAQYEAALQSQQNAEMARAFILGVMSGLASGAVSAPSSFGRSSVGAPGRGGPLRGLVVSPSPGGWHGNTGCVSYIGHTMYVRPC